jgi:hypothetical protein
MFDIFLIVVITAAAMIFCMLVIRNSVTPELKLEYQLREIQVASAIPLENRGNRRPPGRSAFARTRCGRGL